jgi:hypothetical protein
MAKSKKVKAKPSESHQAHDRFAQDNIFSTLTNTRYETAKLDITTGIRDEDGIKLLDKNQLRYSVSGITIHPEFLPYFFNVPNGCPQRLLLFVIFYIVDLKTCEFPFNAHEIKRFNSYCSDWSSASIYKETVVRQAIRDLVDANLVLSVKRSKYMINPMILSGNKTDKWSLINRYRAVLTAKDKGVDIKFFPKYGK